MSNTLSIKSLIDVFSTLSLQSNDIYWVASPDFKRCLYVSFSYEKIFGYSGDALLADIRTWDNALLSTDIKNYHPLLELAKKIRQDGTPKSYNDRYRIVTQTGEIKLIEDQGQSLYTNNGEYIGICGVARDITQKKIVENLSISLMNFPENDSSRYYLKGKYKNIYLTPREAECAFYLLKGNTAKEIGRTLKISNRTVEDALQRIKNKLNVNYQSELIIELIEGQFIQIFQNT